MAQWIKCFNPVYSNGTVNKDCTNPLYKNTLDMDFQQFTGQLKGGNTNVHVGATIQFHKISRKFLFQYFITNVCSVKWIYIQYTRSYDNSSSTTNHYCYIF